MLSLFHVFEIDDRRVNDGSIGIRLSKQRAAKTDVKGMEASNIQGGRAVPD